MVKAANDPVLKMVGSDTVNVHPKGWEFRIQGGKTLMIKSRPWTATEKFAARVFGPLTSSGSTYGIYRWVTCENC